MTVLNCEIEQPTCCEENPPAPDAAKVVESSSDVDTTQEARTATPTEDKVEDVELTGHIKVKALEASRLRNGAFMGRQAPYVKIRLSQEKRRTKHVLQGGVSPIWSESHGNALVIPMVSEMEQLQVEVWQQSKYRPNSHLDSVSIPLEPYVRGGVSAPRWHRLNGSGAILVSIEYEPDEKSRLFLEAIREKHKTYKDITVIESLKEIRYHQGDDDGKLRFGDSIAMHALGQKWVRAQGLTSLNLADTFDEKVIFVVEGQSRGDVLHYGERFHLREISGTKPIQIGTGRFTFVNAVKGISAGESVPVKYGDHICLQVVMPRKGKKILGAHQQSFHVFDSTIHLDHHAPRVVMTITYSDGLVNAPETPPAQTMDLKITTYNVWMMPDKVAKIADVSPMKQERAQLIPLALPDSDVVLFNEAFCHVARPVLMEAMKDKGYLFETPVVGHCVGHASAKFLDSGVVVASKYPIECAEGIRFGAVCHGDDALADKGVIYARIIKDGRRFHLFGSHTQAWDTEAAIATRASQFEMMKHYLDEKNIPRNEPVFLLGDFNVNKFLNDKNGEYTNMLRILDAEDPPAAEDQQGDASFDAHNNPLAADGPSSGGVDERLDYILTSKAHLKPIECWTKVCPIKSTEGWDWPSKKKTFHDLSDHYPVTSNFVFQFDGDDE